MAIMPSTSPRRIKTSVKDFKSNDALYKALGKTRIWELNVIDEQTTKKLSLEDEFYRLGVLKSYGILETPAEPEFDCITREAQDRFQVETAYISFCDFGQNWCKSRQGLRRASNEQKQDRRSSFETHVVHLKQSTAVMVVPDATKDERFCKNPMVTCPGGTRFFAGAPVRSPEGVILGSVCISDPKPRPEGLSVKDCELLTQFANEVVLNIVMR